MSERGEARRSAFALIDLIAVATCVIILLCLTLAFLADTRRHARLGEDLASLKRFGVATGAFAADNDDLLWGLSWQGGGVYEMLTLDGDYETVTPANDWEAGRLQLVHLIRLLDDRIGEGGMPEVDMVPWISYSHLPLMEYLGQTPLARWTTSVADDVRQNWKDDPVNKFDQGHWLPLQPDPQPDQRRLPYSAGFRVVPAAWDYNQSDLDNGVNGDRVQHASMHDYFLVPNNAKIYGRTLADVAYPGAKVQIHDAYQRYYGPVRYYAVKRLPDSHDDASTRLPLLMFDGAASVRSTIDSNPGWRPTTPTFLCMTFWYQPAPWEPATTNGEEKEFSIGRYYWTRGGLKGLDFGGLPLDTGQPDPGECDL